MKPGPVQQGFTLIELLVALFIFGMLAVSGALLLRQSAAASDGMRQKLDDMSAIERAATILTQDLAQSVARPTREQGGGLIPAFEGLGSNSHGLLMRFVRGGYESGEELPQAALQRVDYYLADGVLSRAASSALDGGAPVTRTPMVRGLGAVQLRYRSAQGAWSSMWQPASASELPAAVELRMARAVQGELRLLFLVAPQEEVADAAP